MRSRWPTLRSSVRLFHVHLVFRVGSVFGKRAVIQHSGRSLVTGSTVHIRREGRDFRSITTDPLAQVLNGSLRHPNVWGGWGQSAQGSTIRR